MKEVLETWPATILMPKYIRNNEVLSVRHSLENLSEITEIVLEPYFEAGLIYEVFLQDSEANLFINLASEMDDGEARCGAIAFHRQYIVCTDDRAAIRIFGANEPRIFTIGTLDLIRFWAKKKNIRSGILRNVLRNIKERASYIPGSSHALYSWWQEVMES